MIQSPCLSWSRRRVARAWCWLVWSLLAAPAVAHPELQNPIWIEVAPDRLEVKLFVSMRELNVVQGLPIAVDGAVDIAEAVEAAPRHSPYVLEHLNFRADGVPLPGKVRTIEPPKSVGQGVEGPDRAHFIYFIEYPVAGAPARIQFSQSMVKEFPSAPSVPWNLSYLYRFRPLGAPQWLQFGALPRETEVVYETNFPPTAASRAAAVAVVSPHRALMMRLVLFGLALGLGIGSWRWLARILGLAALALGAGWLLGMGLGWKMPGFLAGALGGIGILLVSVDNIHRPLAVPQARRWIMAGIFPAVAGWAAWSVAGEVPFPPPAFLGLCLTALAGGCLVGSVPAMGLAARPAAEHPPKYGLLQLVSLLICGGGLMILFDGLGIRPWAYWLDRFFG